MGLGCKMLYLIGRSIDTSYRLGSSMAGILQSWFCIVSCVYYMCIPSIAKVVSFLAIAFRAGEVLEAIKWYGW